MTLNSAQTVPFSQLSLLALKLENVDFRSNLLGIDITKYNPRRVINSFATKPIFEGLSSFSTDYELQSGKVLKKGMYFSGTGLGVGSSDVEMVYSYSKFAEEWGVNLGVSGTKKGVTAGLDVGYSQFDDQERSSTNMYAFTREQYSAYDITIDPFELKLDEGFIADVKGVTSAVKARNFANNYGTHYATRVFYGGERSLYATMDSTTYARAKGFGIDIKAKVSASKPGTQKQTSTQAVSDDGQVTDGTKKITGSTDSSQIASGSLGFQFSNNQQEAEILQRASSGYIMIGGRGGFNSWTVDESNSVAIAAEMAPLVDLLVDDVFKGKIPSSTLAKSRSLIQSEVNKRLQSLQSLPAPLPAPRVYTIHLKRLEVIHEVDDLSLIHI